MQRAILILSYSEPVGFFPQVGGALAGFLQDLTFEDSGSGRGRSASAISQLLLSACWIEAVLQGACAV